MEDESLPKQKKKSKEKNHPDFPKNIQYAKKYIDEFIKRVEHVKGHKLEGMRIRISGEGTKAPVVMFSYCTHKKSPNYATPQEMHVDHKKFVDSMKVLYYQYEEITIKGNATGQSVAIDESSH